MLLNRFTALPNGIRVLLRLPHGSDRNALAELHERSGLAVTELDLSRLLRFDPRRRTAVCVTAWVGGTHALVGFATADHAADEPELVLTAEALAAELGALLTAAVFERVRRPDA